MFLLFKLLLCLVAIVGLVFAASDVFCVCFWICVGYFMCFNPFNSAISAYITVQWSLLVHSGGSDFFCASLAYVTALCSILRGPGHLFDPFLILCNYCYTVVVCFGFVVGEPTPFSMLGSPTSSSFRI
jgi:hypothetical protein